MINELKGEDLIFNILYSDVSKAKYYFKEENEFYKKLEDCVRLDSNFFNLFIIDDYGSLSYNELINYIKNLYKIRDKPKDICFVSTGDKYEYKCISLAYGQGKILCETLDNIKTKIKEEIFEFFNSDSMGIKEKVLKKINDYKDDKMGVLIKESENLGFQVNSIENGFTFSFIKL